MLLSTMLLYAVFSKNNGCIVMLSFVFCVYRFDFDIDGFAIMIDF